MKFAHMPDRPASLTKDWALQAYSALTERVDGAEAQETAKDWLHLSEDWNELKSYVSSEQARLSYRYTKDMGNGEAEAAERIHRQEVVPVAEDGEAKLVAALLASKHSAAVAERFGDQLLNVLRVGEPALAPENSELRVEVSDLAKSYDKLVAEAEVDVQGEKMTLSLARSRTISPDADTRRAAYEAHWGWFLEHRDELAAIFQGQVERRDEMGKRLGHENFVPLGYAMMGRTDYGPEQAAAFRASVRQHASPLFLRMATEHAANLGTPALRPWDEGYNPKLCLPLDVAEPIGEQLDKMGRILKRLSPRLLEHFERMRSENLIDLENRKGKASGAYCTDFSDESRAAIFCNSTGGASDVGTLSHELGHAFQAWESMPIDAVNLRWPTADAAEIHSMGMEFLSLPYMDEFFTPEQEAAFTRGRWKKAITLCCYVCTVDEFQHWVYEHPAASWDERDAAFVRIRDTYMPGLDWSGEAARFAPARWYGQLHIFRYPFYYIDYAIAETSAMQLGMLDARDHEGCLEKYFALCRLGGTKSLLGILEASGLESPFGSDLMPRLMAHAARKVGL